MALDAELAGRTLGRNAAVWQNYDDGLLSTLDDLDRLVNRLSEDSVRQGMAVTNEAAALEAELRDRVHELEMQGVEQDRQLAFQKIQAQRQALACKIAGEEALLAAREYDAKVQALIMAAREFAAKVERQEILLAKARAQMDVKKAEAENARLEAEIATELYHQANVMVDIARAKLDVAKANTRAVMADIEAQEADLKVIQADLDIAMQKAEKATLTADVAHILADIIVRGLAKVKFQVEEAEIEAGFRWIDQKLADMLAIWGDRQAQEKVRAEYEELYRREVEKQTVLQKDQEDLRLDQMNNDVEVHFYLRDKLDGSHRIREMRPGGITDEEWQNLQEALDGRSYEGDGVSIADCDFMQKENQRLKKENLSRIKNQGETALDDTRSWAEMLVDAARTAAQTYMETFEYEARLFSQQIHKGFFFVSPPGGAAQDGDGGPPPPANIQDDDPGERQC